MKTKIRRIEFINHPVLDNLQLDFCNSKGEAYDTVIIAGENGTGKSTILNEIYSFFTRDVKEGKEINLEVEYDGLIRQLNYHWVNNIGDNRILEVLIDGEKKLSMHDPFFEAEFKPFVIFSDIDVKHNSRIIPSITGISLDELAASRRSSDDMASEMKQMLVDIQAMDDAEIANTVLANPEKSFNELNVETRMARFTDAFSVMFEDLRYSRIINKAGFKQILFKKNDSEIPIDALSSGEKHIIYRGSFLLKDVNAIKGAVVLIDEPEASLHPKWQMKILDYYKRIFTDRFGTQTSQIIAATHSPFIIHNDYRYNDKVIVLTHKGNQIDVSDKQEYYNCNSIDAVRDAFDIAQFESETPTVFLEGRTDEQYFNSTIETFGLTVPFEFEWVGHLVNDREEFTGKDSLVKAANFLRGRSLKSKKICLFDVDTEHKNRIDGLVYEICMPQFDNSKEISVGIENALIMDDIDISGFYSKKTKRTGYGETRIITTLDKMEMCNYICGLPKEERKAIFKNLKTMIEDLTKIVRGD